MDFIYGIIGFLGFEGLKIYKRLWDGRPIIPLTRKSLYAAILLIVGAFSGVISLALGDGSIAKAVFVGFSVPSILKSLFENPRARRQDPVEDIYIHKPRIIARTFNWIDRFFRFD